MAMFPWSEANEIDRFCGIIPGFAEFFSSAVDINTTCQYC
jgi:hypothetical protein